MNTSPNLRPRALSDFNYATYTISLQALMRVTSCRVIGTSKASVALAAVLDPVLQACYRVPERRKAYADHDLARSRGAKIIGESCCQSQAICDKADVGRLILRF
jgi:hypothetical protein